MALNTDNKKNCWEVKGCGREPGGEKAKELGVCPASTDDKYAGSNNGKHAGRYCWKVAGTLCGGVVQGTWAAKLRDCLACEFFKGVKQEEDSGFQA